MLNGKKMCENGDPTNKSTRPKKMVAEILVKGQARTKPVVDKAKRAFGDITNASTLQNDKKKLTAPIKPVGKASTINKISKPVMKKEPGIKKKTDLLVNIHTGNITSCKSLSDSIQISSLKPSTKITQSPCNKASEVHTDRVEEDFSFVIIEDAVVQTETEVQDSHRHSEQILVAADLENYTDVFNVSIYAQHIFDYYKRREKMFLIPAYMVGGRCRLTPIMRAILVDWMVEVQENFELNHETLYLAVKLVDMYLSRVSIDKDILQLVGAAAIFIASKFDERCPPLIEDFTYICDNSFDRDQFISMELEILRAVDFDIGFPISYTFLRRYAKVAHASMVTLTLARFILEMSLMEYDLVTARDSQLAAAALYIAQKMRKDGSWEGDVIKSSGYTLKDIVDLIVTLNKMLIAAPVSQLSTVRSKYSHQVFHEVAKIKPCSTEQLLQV